MLQHKTSENKKKTYNILGKIVVMWPCGKWVAGWVAVHILEPPAEKCQTTSDHLSGPDD